MITPAFNLTATERVLPNMALDFTTAALDSRVTITRALNTATRVNSSGFIEIVNANLPRFDFTPATTPVCRGLLIEETRTNLFLNSLIDGTNLATQSVTLSATSYMLSFYGTGSVVISGGHSATVDGAGAFPTRKTYAFTPTAGSSTFTVTGDVKFAQLEAGTFSTSFIPTAASSVLRNADAVSMTGTNFSDWYNATEGTFVCSVQAVNGRLLSANNGTTSKRILAAVKYSETQFGGVVTDGVNQASLAANVANASAINKIATAYKANSFAFDAAGGTVQTDSLGTVPAVNQLQIGADTTFQGTGWFQTVTYYPQRLLNAEVQAFSK